MRVSLQLLGDIGVTEPAGFIFLGGVLAMVNSRRKGRVREGGMVEVTFRAADPDSSVNGVVEVLFVDAEGKGLSGREHRAHSGITVASETEVVGNVGTSPQLLSVCSGREECRDHAEKEDKKENVYFFHGSGRAFYWLFSMHCLNLQRTGSYVRLVFFRM